MTPPSGLNGSSLSLHGFSQLSEQRLLFFCVFAAAYLFVVLSDSLVVYLVLARRSLHRPMYVFVAALLLNSLLGSTAIYPKLLRGFLSDRAVSVSRSECLVQAFLVYMAGASSFLLLSVMAFDRYLSICRPMRYASLMTPSAVSALLLGSWLLPVCLVGGFTLQVGQLQLCSFDTQRLFCNTFTFMKLSCGGRETAAAKVYGLFLTGLMVFLPACFVLFSYCRILAVCLRRSRAFSWKALYTCLPHLLVFFNYLLCTGYELIGLRLQPDRDGPAALAASIGMMIVPTVFNPVIYGLKTREVFKHVKALLSCQRQ
ncbi:olfactory receptor 11A1-like [Genypterus blacodes]|uniref:olfactory receptor 11A1-like n=1 Tax=Genypterus blacodes TaxID=154954 RepID=UPI003F767718